MTKNSSSRRAATFAQSRCNRLMRKQTSDGCDEQQQDELIRNRPTTYSGRKHTAIIDHWTNFPCLPTMAGQKPIRLPPVKSLRVRNPNKKAENPCISVMSSVLGESLSLICLSSCFFLCHVAAASSYRADCFSDLIPPQGSPASRRDDGPESIQCFPIRFRG